MAVFNLFVKIFSIQTILRPPSKLTLFYDGFNAEINFFYHFVFFSALGIKVAPVRIGFIYIPFVKYVKREGHRVLSLRRHLLCMTTGLPTYMEECSF